MLLLLSQTDQGSRGVFQRVWGDRPNPPLITVAVVSALAHPEFLAEMDVIAVVPDQLSAQPT